MLHNSHELNVDEPHYLNSGTRLSGSNRDDKKSNLFWVSRENEVSIKVIGFHTLHIPVRYLCQKIG